MTKLVDAWRPDLAKQVAEVKEALVKDEMARIKEQVARDMAAAREEAKALQIEQIRTMEQHLQAETQQKHQQMQNSLMLRATDAQFIDFFCDI